MPRKQLTIRPKEVGSVIRFGKLPIFTRSLTTMADMDNIIQIVVEGRHYAVEMRKSGLEKALEKVYQQQMTKSPQPEKIVEAPEKETKWEEFDTKSHYQKGKARFQRLKDLAENGELESCKNRLDLCDKMGFERKISGTGYNWLSMQIRKGYLGEELLRYNKQNSGEYRYYLTGKEPNYTGNKHIAERAKSQGLEEMGFVNLSKPAKQMKVKVQRRSRADGTDYAGRPLERGDLSLWEWLNKDDYAVNALFVSDTGRPLVEKMVDHDDFCLLFLNAGLPDRGKRSPAQKGKTAQNYTNIVITQLLRKGVIQKEESESGKKMYGLTLTKGGAYARGVYATIREGAYDWDEKSHRRVIKLR